MESGYLHLSVIGKKYIRDLRLSLLQGSTNMIFSSPCGDMKKIRNL